MINITDDEFAYLVSLAKKNFGVNLIKKRTLVESRLTNYFIKKNIENFSQYFELLNKDVTNNEMTQLINILTTNYSYFMREHEHFDYLNSRVLPHLKNTIKDFDLRIWSAGCSTGQEPYTLAMILTDFFRETAVSWDYKVLATDISQKVLTKAVEGKYLAEEIEKVPPSWKLNYFNNLLNGEFEVNKHIKNQVIFRKFNLMQEQFPFKKKFHVIFCRNVMIYFDKETKNDLVRKFYDMTQRGGYLFVGQSEGVDTSIIPYEYVMPSVYRKK